MTFKNALYASISACVLLAGAAGAANAGQLIITSQGKPNAHGIAPKFAMIRRLQTNIHDTKKPASFPPTWVFSYTYSGKTYNETFIGTAASGGASTTVPVEIIPLKLVSGSTSEDPTVITQNGVSVIQNVLNSPLFNGVLPFTSGGVALGTTQYEDAFQRGNLWGTVKSHTGYHVLLGTPTVAAVQTLTLTSKTGSVKNPFGNQSVIVANINTIDSTITSLITSLKVPAGTFPLFIGANNYLYSGSYNSGCCIGGYHSVTSAGEPYSYSSYITVEGNFAQDVGALSHELGEWVDDPLTANTVPAACGSGAVLEVGDPLEGNTNYGDYAYKVGSATYNLQDLTYLEYFGAPTTTSAGGKSTFQGETLAFCSNGG